MKALSTLSNVISWTCWGHYDPCKVCDDICFLTEDCKKEQEMAKKKSTTPPADIDQILDDLMSNDASDEEKESAESEASTLPEKKETKEKVKADIVEETTSKTDPKEEPKEEVVLEAESEEERKEKEIDIGERYDKYSTYFLAPFKELEDVKGISLILATAICPHITEVTERSNYFKFETESFGRLFIYLPTVRRKKMIRVEVKKDVRYEGKVDIKSSAGGNFLIDLNSEEEATNFCNLFSRESIESDGVPPTLDLKDVSKVILGLIKEDKVAGDTDPDELKKLLLTEGKIDSEVVDALSSEMIVQILEKVKQVVDVKDAKE